MTHVCRSDWWNGRRRLFVAMFVAAALLALSYIVPASVAHAAETEVFRTDLSIPYALGCTGERVMLSGTLNNVVKFDVSLSGVSAKFHFNTQGVQGVGENTGKKYTLVWTGNEGSSLQLDPSRENYTLVTTFMLVEHGAGPVYRSTFNLHFVVRNLQVVSYHLSQDSGCVRV